MPKHPNDQGNLKFQTADLKKEPHCVSLGSALYRMARATRFYMRNGLIGKGLEANLLKNGPPASASARVSPEELFFRKNGGTDKRRSNFRRLRTLMDS